MKNIKDNKGITNMTLITIVLVIIILMLLVAVIYLVKNPNTTYITQNLPTEQSQLSSTIKENEAEVSTPSIKKDMNADERFAIYAKGLKESISKFYEFGETFDGEKYKCAVPVDCDIENAFGIDEIVLKYNGELHLKIASNSELNKKYGSEYKIASNVIKAGAMKYGQDGAIVIYAINNSGEFSYSLINLTSNELKMQTIDSFKNIVEVQRYNNGETSMLLVAIDIDGIMHDIKIK